ncbi:Taurine dioxygenase, alpha-ketoglutarate-dependent [Pseudomonas sp. NFACC32-1]|uniref:TauD/TfdA family dioxygenase n=1 Tax=unclassified Pseudomonas TaxID=196821 RepID=UPI0008769DE2|nr:MULTISPECIES: TauD/TfdA family dioxygenase [unclassified Pseudomonas]SCX67360.1 Taurine dioxygenase, alpha-ketoglutarate-dependent [Pseudomonas sp. NFACC32-1]SFW91036.1 Taurine dioxygenase, alpha-ketoglutarate-dependent [Pseudomonas sp. NFACC09-4]
MSLQTNAAPVLDDDAPADTLAWPGQDDGAVRLSLLADGLSLPVVVEPNDPGLDPAQWAGQHRGAIEALLCRHGAVLFRGFDLASVPAFEAFAEALSPGLHGSYGDLPKKEGGRNVYRSTPYPEREMILYHNESSHLESWPRKQWFYCEQPSRVGGATPLADIRQVLQRLPEQVVARFEQKGLMYSRTFTAGVEPSWESFFGTTDRAAVEQRCREQGTDFEWLDADTLQVRTLCPAVIRHPLTGEPGFFNQVQLHHPFCLGEEMREDLLDMFGADRLPRMVSYGDGTPIEDDVMALVGEAYEACAVRFAWRKGDVVMLDNMLAAHARDPYEEPRLIVVAMGEMTARGDVWQPA